MTHLYITIEPGSLSQIDLDLNFYALSFNSNAKYRLLDLG